VTSTVVEGNSGLSVSSSVEDDKLKNLDQKMVDLIMHEVSSTYCKHCCIVFLHNARILKSYILE
jgi:hypothetical protein